MSQNNMTRSRILGAAALFLLALAGVGCSELSPLTQERVADGIDRITVNATTTQEQLILYRFAAGRFDWSVEHASTSRTVASWFEHLNKPVAVANGVYFNEDGMPSGLLIDDGIPVGSRRFDDDKSGLITLGGQPSIINTQNEYAPALLPEAAQSFPLLLIDGKAQVKVDTEKKARRTFFATDIRGNAYLGMAPLGSLSLYELSNLLAKSGLDLDRAINLDGGPSTGIAVQTENGLQLENSMSEIPNVIIVRRK